MPSKTFTALGHLQDYVDASEKAHNELKSCMWQLTKSRRNVRSGILGVDSTTAYTAALLREELRARLRVVDVVDDNGNGNGNDEELDLINEDSVPPPVKGKDKDDDSSNSNNSSKIILCPQWKLYNVLLEREKARKSATSNKPSSSSSSAHHTADNDPTESTGMRQRKATTTTTNNNKKNIENKAATTITSSSSWTMVREEDLNSDDDDNDDNIEDEKILQTDPIKLFGGYFTARELKVAQRDAQQALNGYIQAANEAAKLLALLREKE